MNTSSKFWARVDRSSDCWIWTGFVSKDGYGSVSYQGERWRVHRLTWVLENGPIPNGLTIDHLCFDTLCCNPSHLRLLAHVDNAANQRSALATHCVNGHEYTPENTYLRPDGCSGRRDCRACISDRVRRYKRRRKDSAA